MRTNGRGLDWKQKFTCRLPNGTELNQDSTVGKDAGALARGQKIGESGSPIIPVLKFREP